MISNMFDKIKSRISNNKSDNKTSSPSVPLNTVNYSNVVIPNDIKLTNNGTAPVPAKQLSSASSSPSVQVPDKQPTTNASPSTPVQVPAKQPTTNASPSTPVQVPAKQPTTNASSSTPVQVPAKQPTTNASPSTPVQVPAKQPTTNASPSTPVQVPAKQPTSNVSSPANQAATNAASASASASASVQVPIKQPIDISKAILSPTSTAPVTKAISTAPMSVTSSAMPVNNITTSPTSSAPVGNPTLVNDKKQQGGYFIDQSVMFMYGGCVNLQSDMHGGVNKDKEMEKIFYQENSLEEPKKPTQTGGSIRRKNTTGDKHMDKIFYQQNSVEEPKNQKKVNIPRQKTVEEPDKSKQNGTPRRVAVEEPGKHKQKGGNIQSNLVSLIPSNLRDLSEESYSNYNNELLRLKAIYYGNQYKN